MGRDTQHYAPKPNEVSPSGGDGHRTHFKTDFEARLSEKLVGKAGGEKGSKAYWSTSRTVFADNAVPRALQPIAAERSS